MPTLPETRRHPSGTFISKKWQQSRPNPPDFAPLCLCAGISTVAFGVQGAAIGIPEAQQYSERQLPATALWELYKQKARLASPLLKEAQTVAKRFANHNKQNKPQ
jgi:hypothetical protein